MGQDKSRQKKMIKSEQVRTNQNYKIMRTMMSTEDINFKSGQLYREKTSGDNYVM